MQTEGITVAASLGPALERLLAAARADGIVLGGSGWPSSAVQAAFRPADGCPDVYDAPPSSCQAPTARPGTSEHEKVLAVDFTWQGPTICFPHPDRPAGTTPRSTGSRPTRLATGCTSCSARDQLLAGCPDLPRGYARTRCPEEPAARCASCARVGSLARTERRLAVPHLREALVGLTADGVFHDLPLEPLVRLISSGGMNEAALAMRQAADPRQELDATTFVLEQLLSTLLCSR